MRALKLYELDDVEGQSTSSFVWRIKFARRHKGIAYEACPWDSLGWKVVSESWVIAEWLDEPFPIIRVYSRRGPSWRWSNSLTNGSEQRCFRRCSAPASIRSSNA
jgi:glutathione S-transferase